MIAESNTCNMSIAGSGASRPASKHFQSSQDRMEQSENSQSERNTTESGNGHSSHAALKNPPKVSIGAKAPKLLWPHKTAATRTPTSIMGTTTSASTHGCE